MGLGCFLISRRYKLRVKRTLKALFQAVLATSIVGVLPVRAADPIGTRPDQLQFREIYKELVETDTSVATGDCTVLVDKIAQRMKAGGFTDAEIYRFTPGNFPKGGGIVATLPGASRTAKAVLLLGHIDVVNAPPKGWAHSPFQFTEDDGLFYGRGTADMKDLDAIWIDTMLRLRARGGKQARTLKMALTCGEEGGWPFNGARWLTENERALIDADFAFNEGGGGDVDAGGKLIYLTVGSAEKLGPNFNIEATNPGGHSSVPHPDNAIYDLARALVRISDLHFPIDLNDVTRGFFAKEGAGRSDKVGQAMRTIAVNPRDHDAEETLSANLDYNALLHTTCVPTLLEGGHATNALPQRAAANINCRILPGETLAAVQAALTRAVNQPAISVTFVPNEEPVAGISPVNATVFGPMEQVARKHFPGATVVPTMITAGSDSRYLRAVGIPTYGAPGIALALGDAGVHGINEHVGVQALYQGRDYLFDLIEDYLTQR